MVTCGKKRARNSHGGGAQLLRCNVRCCLDPHRKSLDVGDGSGVRPKTGTDGVSGKPGSPFPEAEWPLPPASTSLMPTSPKYTTQGNFKFTLPLSSASTGPCNTNASQIRLQTGSFQYRAVDVGNLRPWWVWFLFLSHCCVVLSVPGLKQYHASLGFRLHTASLSAFCLTSLQSDLM